MSGSPRLYLEALRQARPRQLAGRMRRPVPPAIMALGLRPRSVDGWRPLAAGMFAPAAPQSGPAEPIAQSAHLSFAGESRSLDDPALWSTDANSLLFLFGAHGFDALTAEVANETAEPLVWRRLVDRWLEQFRTPSLPAWHPYPTSRRILAWLSAASAGVLPLDVLPAIDLHARYLDRVLEHDVGGNHLIVNAVALCAAAHCLGQPRRALRSQNLLQRELQRQVLSDGAHEERSPSYHRELLALLTDVANLLDTDFDQRARMRRWLGELAGPDGTLPLFNDSWNGPPLRLASARDDLVELEPSGFVVLRHGRDQVVMDVGPLAPPHLPAHAHADALSFVLWMDGRPVVIDPGAGVYTGPYRNIFRGTAAHATAAVDDRDQCVFWGDFRASFMPTVQRGPCERRGDLVVLRASHDGYARLEDPVRHHRLFCWVPGGGVVVVDWLEAAGDHSVTTSLPLAGPLPPGIAVQSLGSGPPATLRDVPIAPYIGAIRPGRAYQRTFRVAPQQPFGWAVLRQHVAARIDGQVLVLDRPGEPAMSVALRR